MKQKPTNPIFSNRDLIHLVIPLVIELALKLVVGLLDSIMVSSVGEAAVSGVSLIDSVFQLLIYIFAALAAGGAIVAGQRLGAGKRDEAKRSADELMWMNVVISLVIMLLMFAISEWILTHVFGSIDADVYYHAKRYLFVAIFSIPAIGIFEAGTAIFRTMNDSATTMKISLLMNAVNAVGNALLIYVCKMGTQGAALSTLVSRWLAVGIVVWLLLNPNRELSLKRSLRHRFNWNLTKNILRLGIPNGVENGIFQLGKIVLLGFVATFGTSAITANAVTQTLASLEVIPGNAIQLAMIPVISRCVGKKDYEQARYYNRKLMKMAYAAMWIWCGVMVLSLPGILKIYKLSAETAKLMITMFVWHTAGAVTLWPLSFDLPASLRASGDVRFPMVISILSMWTMRLGGAHFLGTFMQLGALGVWIAMAMLDWGFRGTIYVFRWRSGKWMEMRLDK
ncbi:MATE family efflux transporter [Clostridium sp. AF32-12BH]|uniref:MATE family efflux transporter n=1 Tax=Clostridium sp. AF32-12BH TaxID=2292006 RepID=UPI000E5412CE|nr:MATE family efflux transporter [Clostridium sp. AF32-12BH]RHP44991.1 MATE family efflux transporter [Clostridium sp. AF32-12BH]